MGPAAKCVPHQLYVRGHHCVRGCLDLFAVHRPFPKALACLPEHESSLAQAADAQYAEDSGIGRSQTRLHASARDMC